MALEILALARCPVIVFSADLRVVYLNQYAADFLQQPFAAAGGKPLRDLLPVAEAAQIVEAIRCACDDRNEIRFDVELPSAKAWYRVHGFPLSSGEFATQWLDISELKGAETDLSATNNELESILDSFTEGLTKLDSELRVTYLNAAAEKIMYAPRQRLAGKRLFTEYPIGEEVESRCRQVIAEGQPVSFEWVYGPSDRWFLVNIYPARDGGVSIVFRDITERKRALRALEKNNERLEIAFRSGHIGSFEWVMTTGEVIWSDDQQRLFGFAPGSFPGTLDAWLQCLHPDDRPAFEGKIRSCIQQQTRDADFEYRILRDGQVASVSGSGRFYYDQCGNATRLIGFVQDVTTRKEIERNLAETNQQLTNSVAELTRLNRRLQVAQQAGKMGSFEWFIPENRLLWTPELEDLYGLTPGEFEGTFEDWQKRVHPDDLPICQEIVISAFAAHQDVAEYIFRALLPAGDVRWLFGRAMFTYADDGAPLSMIGVNIDYTDRKLIERRLEQANERLARSNEDLQRFAYVASHDLQEPLRTVASYTQLLVHRNEGKLDEDSQEFIRFINSGVDRMRALIRDLLEFSRITHEDQPSVPVDCNAVLGLALQHLQFKIEEARAKITFDRLPTVLGHEGRLAQVFQNLIGNSLKYSERDPEIHVSASHSEGEWTISVRDNGIGIDSAHHDRIFGLFTRLHGRNEYAGTGLGLAICKRIVEQHGGRIWVESNPGQGATFRFTLPAAP